MKIEHMLKYQQDDLGAIYYNLYTKYAEASKRNPIKQQCDFTSKHIESVNVKKIFCSDDPKPEYRRKSAVVNPAL